MLHASIENGTPKTQVSMAALAGRYHARVSPLAVPDDPEAEMGRQPEPDPDPEDLAGEGLDGQGRSLSDRFWNDLSDKVRDRLLDQFLEINADELVELILEDMDRDELGRPTNLRGLGGKFREFLDRQQVLTR